SPAVNAQVVDSHINSLLAEAVDDKRFYPAPFSPGEAAADAWHVDRCLQFQGLLSHLLQGDFHSLISRGWAPPATFHAVLGDHVGDPDVGFDLDQLHRAKTEIILVATLMPFPIGALRLGPASRDGHDETFPPLAQVVANMGDDFHALGLG